MSALLEQLKGALGSQYRILAELYQAKGDKERARYYYGRFIDNWKDADPGLQPKVREARRRMAELVAEPAN